MDGGNVAADGTANGPESDVQARSDHYLSNMPPGYDEAIETGADHICDIHGEYFNMVEEGGCPSCMEEWRTIEAEDA